MPSYFFMYFVIDLFVSRSKSEFVVQYMLMWIVVGMDYTCIMVQISLHLNS